MTFLHSNAESCLAGLFLKHTFWSRPFQTLCVVYIWIVRLLVIQYDSGNSGSFGVCFFIIFFYIFLAWWTLGKIFLLSVGTGCLFSPDFCSRCVCQLRPQLWCLEDVITFVPVSCVPSYTFGSGMLCSRTLRCFESDFVLQIKEKVERERCCMFFPFSYFSWWMCGFNNDRQQTPTYLYLLSQSDLCFFLLPFQWIVFKSISWVVAVSLTGRWEGKKKFHLSAESRNNITFP